MCCVMCCVHHSFISALPEGWSLVSISSTTHGPLLSFSSPLGHLRCRLAVRFFAPSLHLRALRAIAIPCFSWDILSRWFPVAFLTLPNLSRLGTGMADVIAMAGEWSLLGNLFYPFLWDKCSAPWFSGSASQRLTPPHKPWSRWKWP